MTDDFTTPLLSAPTWQPNRRQAGALIATTLVLIGSAFAQAKRQIIVVVPFPPGGSLDSLARMVTQKVAEQSNDFFVVENKPGANGNIGARAAMQAAPDGRTLLFGHDALLTVNDALYQKQPDFDGQGEMKAATALAQSPSILVVHPDFPPKSIKEFIDFGKQNEIQYASGGAGSAGHLTMEYFGMATGLKLRHIPYRGGAPAMNDLIAGHVPAAFVAIGGAIGHVKSGKLRALAVSTAARVSEAPDTPTVAESGYPGFEFAEMYFVFVNVKTPTEIVADLGKQVQAALDDPGVQAKIRQLGMEPVAMPAEAATAWLRSARETKTKLVADIGVKPQ